MLEGGVVRGGDVPGGVEGDPERQRDERVGERRKPGQPSEPQAASGAEMPSTTSAGAHSASMTFWRRCAETR